jgi:hypothetical protein
VRFGASQELVSGDSGGTVKLWNIEKYAGASFHVTSSSSSSSSSSSILLSIFTIFFSPSPSSFRDSFLAYS